MIDHYNNLTLKSVFSLKYFLNESNFQSPAPFYMMKIDNDAYLNVPSLIEELKSEDKYPADNIFILGYR